MAKQSLLFFTMLLVVSARGYVTQWNKSNQLHPVHGLFVKPSNDGITGDLYVAATEDNGVKTQWLTDQPINFLPVGAASQTQQTAIPISYGSNFPPAHDEGKPQKRAVMSPPFQYAYALPVPSSTPGEGSVVAPFSYAVPASSSALPSGTERSSATPCSMDPAKANVPQYSPFPFFYPQMMSAYANAIGLLKDVGLSENTANSVMSQTSLWSPYAYPMYVMMDPSAWAKNQASSTTTDSTNESSEENLQT